MIDIDFTDLPKSFAPARSLRALLHAEIRQDFAVFIHRCFQTVSPGDSYLHNWHIDAIAHHLELVRTGEIRRLIITMPPRSMKSICASVAFPAWLLGHDPTTRIICASYAEGLSATLSNQFRAVLSSEWYRRTFPWTKLDPSKNTETEVMTTQRGSRFATSVGGTLTGRGGRVIIIDDPLKPTDGKSKRTQAREWFDNTLYSRLDDKKRGAIVLVMQRVHMEDLAGYLLEKGGWTHLNLPAIAEAEQTVAVGPNTFHTRLPDDVLHPDREPRSALEEIKRNINSYNFSAQYLQQPVPEGGTLIPWKWFQSYDRPPVFDRDMHHRITMSWDTASKSTELANYSVGQTWHVTPKGFFLINQVRRKLDYPDLKHLIMNEAEDQGARTILIEDKGSGTSLIQELRRVAWNHWRPNIVAILPKEDKVVRMHAQTLKLQEGRVFLPFQASWLDEFKTEMCAFPNGSNDDQVDAMSQYLQWEDDRLGMLASVGIRR